MAGFLGVAKLFQVRTEKDKLDTSTLPDPDGPLSRDISCSSIGITNPRHFSAAGSIK